MKELSNFLIVNLENVFTAISVARPFEKIFEKYISMNQFISDSLSENCPKTEVFHVCIFPNLVQMRKNTDQKDSEYEHFFTQ